MQEKHNLVCVIFLNAALHSVSQARRSRSGRSDFFFFRGGRGEPLRHAVQEGQFLFCFQYPPPVQSSRTPPFGGRKPEVCSAVGPAPRVKHLDCILLNKMIQLIIYSSQIINLFQFQSTLRNLKREKLRCSKTSHR